MCDEQEILTMELRYEDGWLLEMDADAGVYDVYDEKRCLLQQVTRCV